MTQKPSTTNDFSIKGQESPQEIQKLLLDERVGKLEKDIEVLKELKQELKTDKTTLITLLALFAAVIMFLLGDIQIFKMAAGYWQLVGFSLILLSSLLFFVIVIDYISRGWINSRTEKPPKQTWELLLIIGLIFGLGTLFSFLGNNDSARSNNLKIQKMEQRMKVLSNKVDSLRNRENIF